MAEGDVSLLVTRLTSYSQALDRHNEAIQQAYGRAQESLANLRWVYAGAAAEDFLSQWDRTTEALTWMAAGRPICSSCAGAIREAGAFPAGPLRKSLGDPNGE